MKKETIPEKIKTTLQRISRVGWVILVLIILCSLLYIASMFSGFYIIADILLAVSAGLSTGLVIHAIANYRSKREGELIDIAAKSQKAIDGYCLLYRSLNERAILSLYPDESRDINEIYMKIRDGHEALITNIQILRFKDRKTLVKLNDIDKLLLEPSFIKNMSETMFKLMEPENLQEYQTLMRQFEIGIKDVYEILFYIHLDAEEELAKLRHNLI